MTAVERERARNGATDSALTRIETTAATSDPDGFVYIVTHDLRSSARALIEIPQWLREDLDKRDVPLDDDLTENFDLLERHAKRLDRMLLDLLVYSRIGRLQQVTQIATEDIINDVIAERALPEHVTLRTDGSLPHVLMGYRDAFVLVKTLVDNVAKHGDQKGVTLTISGFRERDTVTLTFTDDGPGVAANDVQRMFRPMTTLRRRDEVEGSGMGLAILKRIVEQYGGAVWAGSGPDDIGFRVRVRIRDAAVSDAGPTDTERCT